MTWTYVKQKKRVIIPVFIILMLAFSVLGLIHAGRVHFQGYPDEIVRGEFLSKFQNYSQAMLYYFTAHPILLGMGLLLVIYLWMSARLYYKYFNIFKPTRWLDFLLNPQAIESIPHSLLVLFIYYTCLQQAGRLRFIMLVSFLLISIPFIFKMVEDVFMTAEKEGIVENYLVLPIKNWKIVQLFWKRDILHIFVIPGMFLLILMVYWEFLYSSIGVTGAEKSAPGLFYVNYNDSYLLNYPGLHNTLILLQIGIFALLTGILLYTVYMMRRQLPPALSTAGAKEKSQASRDPAILITCKNLSVVSLSQNANRKSYKQDILRNIDLDIKKGENICIMGESGCGKTTLVREIAAVPAGGLVRDNGTIHNPGNFVFSIFQDVDLYLDPYHTLYYYVKKAFKKRHRQWAQPLKPPPIDCRLLVQYVNDTGLLKPLMADHKQGYDSERITQILRQDDQKGIHQTAGLLVKSLKTRTKQKLSGGEKQKFYLLIALIANPDILIADEIFTDVDSGSINKITSLLFEEKNFTVVFISHDIGMVKELVDQGLLKKVYFMKDGKLSSQVWTHATTAAAVDLTYRGNGMPAWAGDMLKSYHNILAEKMTDPTSFPVEDEMVFNIGDVTRNFGDDRRIIFKNHEENGRSTLKIHKNINYALVGENGSGKTTLFKILTKLSPYNGLITYWDGNPYELRDMPRYLCVNKNQLVFQKTGNAIIEDTPIQEYLLSFFNEREKQLHGIEPKITGLIEAFFPSEQKRQLIPNSLFRELSVGEQRRILLIRSLLLVDRDGILFIDEAMRGMDVFLKERLVHYLKKEQLQIFLISHDKDLVDALCHRKIRLDSKNGKTMIIPDIKNIVKNEINSPAGAFGGNE